jgi:flagellar motor switch protein FliM
VEPILNKQEIADLLLAIKEGRVSTDLSQEGSTPPAKPCKPLNLFDVNAVKEELHRIPNFDIVLDAFCQNYAISLTNLLQRTFSISRIGIDSSQFLEFLLEKKDTGAIGVIQTSPLKHGALLMMDSQLCFAIVEVLLGAATDLDSVRLDRKLSSIELSVMNTVMQNACEDIDRAFKPLMDLRTSLLKVENNSRLVSITAPDAEIIVGQYKMDLGDISGEVHLVFPLATISPLREQLKDLLNVNKGTKGLWTDQITNEIYNVDTEIVAQSGTVTMSINDIINLKPGDIVPLEYNPNKPLKILVEKQLKFFAVPGLHDGKKAISLTGVYE